MLLWFDLNAAFKLAFKREDEKQLARIIAFARWCWASKDHPTNNAVACGFYEHLPLHEPIRESIPLLFSKQEFDQIRSAFAIHAGEPAIEEIARKYRKMNSRLEYRGAGQ